MLVTVLSIALIFSRSRGGIGLGFLGLLLAMVLFSPHFGRKGGAAVIGIIAAVSLGLGAAIGLTPVWERFASLDTLDNIRWEIFVTAFDGAQLFQPLGAGLSSFPEVFARFQRLDMLGFVNRAHNDYLELFFEGGWLMLVPVTVLFVHYLLRWGALLRAGTRGDFARIQLAAGLGMFLMLVHSVFDFNLHIPANMAYFALLSGVFFHIHSPLVQLDSERERRRSESESGLEAMTKKSVIKREIPEENLVNPFAETSGKT
jgi:O-antigen ligase